MEDLFHVEGDGNYETVFEFNLVYDASVSGYDARGCRNLPYLWNWRNDKMLGPDGPGTLYVNQGWGECVPSKKFLDLLIADFLRNHRRIVHRSHFKVNLLRSPMESLKRSLAAR